MATSILLSLPISQTVGVVSDSHQSCVPITSTVHPTKERQLSIYQSDNDCVTLSSGHLRREVVRTVS